jgi:hypothetical protein
MFMVVAPVDRQFGDINPVQQLKKDRAELQSMAATRDPGLVVANGWVSKKESDMTLPSKSGKPSKVFADFLFFSKTEVLQVNLRWVEGNEQQERECRQVLAYGLWSLKVG